MNNFTDLQSIGEKESSVYFVLDSEFLDRISDKDKLLSSKGVQWQEIYVKKLTKGSGEIVIGHLTNKSSR